MIEKVGDMNEEDGPAAVDAHIGYRRRQMSLA
jgi:hypothetical protein